MKPTCRELLDDLWADADEVVKRHLSDQQKLHQAYLLATRVERVLELHGPPSPSEAKHADSCSACGELWPCPTKRLLEGEES